MYQDFNDPLSAFHAHGVEYLIIGGYAVSLHAQPRATKDIDLNSVRDLPPNYAGDGGDFRHQRIELVREKRLVAVGEGAVGIRVDFHDQAVGAHRHGGAREWNHLVALAGSVAGIDQ